LAQNPHITLILSFSHSETERTKDKKGTKRREGTTTKNNKPKKTGVEVITTVHPYHMFYT
jgi:hypothetical protein